MISEHESPERRMDRYVRRAVTDMEVAREELSAALSEVGPNDWQRSVPYGGRTLHDLLAHLAAADHSWALAAQDLLKGEGDTRPPLTPKAAAEARQRAIARGRRQSTDELLDEMARRRKLLLSLFELLDPRHLALSLRAFGDEHNSVREHIWLGYHDRLHAADVRRALRLQWYPPRLRLLPELQAAAASLDPATTLYVIDNVDPALWERPSDVPGWSFRMLLAHIATGDWVLQTHLRHLLERGEVAVWPDIDVGNAERLANRRLSTHTALVEEYLSMRHETLLLLSQLKAKHLGLPIRFWWEDPLVDRTVLLYVQGFHLHERHHAEQLRSAMKYLR